MRGDLSADLGPEFKGEYLDRYVPSAPRPTTLVFHSVGASDPLEASDAGSRIDDGLPGTLEEWIARDGLLAFKMKLNGGNLDGRCRAHRRHRSRRDARAGVQARERLEVLLDFNEGCPNVAYLIEVPAARARGHAARLRTDSLHRAADAIAI